MKCQILFSRKNKKNVMSLSPAETAHSLVSVNAKITFFFLLNIPFTRSYDDKDRLLQHMLQ